MNCTTQGLYHPYLKSSLAQKKMILRCALLHRMIYELKYLGKFEVKFEMAA